MMDNGYWLLDMICYVIYFILLLLLLGFFFLLVANRNECEILDDFECVIILFSISFYSIQTKCFDIWTISNAFSSHFFLIFPSLNNIKLGPRFVLMPQIITYQMLSTCDWWFLLGNQWIHTTFDLNRQILPQTSKYFMALDCHFSIELRIKWFFALKRFDLICMAVNIWTFH